MVVWRCRPDFTGARQRGGADRPTGNPIRRRRRLRILSVCQTAESEVLKPVEWYIGRGAIGTRKTEKRRSVNWKHHGGRVPRDTVSPPPAVGFIEKNPANKPHDDVTHQSRVFCRQRGWMDGRRAVGGGGVKKSVLVRWVLCGVAGRWWQRRSGQVKGRPFRTIESVGGRQRGRCCGGGRGGQG